MDIRFTDALKLSRHDAFHVMVKPAGPLCNLNCTYCYYLEKKKLFPEKKVFKLSDDLLENFIKQYIEVQQVPVVTFTWQGGEPTLLGLDYFQRVIKLQRKYSNGKMVENAFQTNGTRLTDDWCMFFTDNDILVGISVDGEEHNHNYYRKSNSGKPVFKKVMKGIELLQKNQNEIFLVLLLMNWDLKLFLAH